MSRNNQIKNLHKIIPLLHDLEYFITFGTLLGYARDESILKKGILRHPIAGRIDINMTLEFIKIHFHHHRKIIAKLESKIKSN